MAIVELRGLVKDYGSQRALNGIDLEIEQGEVFGYLGPNGAGKTTTIRIVLGLLRPTGGRATVFGRDAWTDRVAIHPRIGYVPGEPGLWDRLTGEQTLVYLADLRDAPGDVVNGRSIADRLGLDLGRRVRALSHGNRQKLLVVQAFMSRPDLVVLDEPTAGLDPLVQQEFHALVRETTGRGGTVLLSSHLLDDVQRTADRVGIIRSGRVIAVERLEDLRSKSMHHVTARLAGALRPDILERVPGVHGVRFEGSVVECDLPEPSLDALVKELARHRVTDVSITEAGLEEMFLAYYGGTDADAA